MSPTQTTDWGMLLEELQRAGVSLCEIGRAMDSMMTNRMVRHYMLGVQPAHFRGEALIALWCVKLKRTRAELPTTALIRGHRRHAADSTGPRLQNLPAWPPSPQPAVAPVKRRGRRKASV